MDRIYGNRMGKINSFLDGYPAQSKLYAKLSRFCVYLKPSHDLNPKDLTNFPIILESRSLITISTGTNNQTYHVKCIKFSSLSEFTLNSKTNPVQMFSPTTEHKPKIILLKSTNLLIIIVSIHSCMLTVSSLKHILYIKQFLQSSLHDDNDGK